MTLLKMAAIQWYLAEYPDRVPDPILGPWSDIYAVAIPRVIQVWKGEVRWSEASPGDRAVWKGRARDVELVTPRPIRGLGLRLTPMTPTYVNMYDTLRIHRDLPCQLFNMFGNVNVGNHRLTNMQVAGQMVCDAHVNVHQLYCAVDRDLTNHDEIFVDLVIGCRPHWSGPIREAVRGVPVGTTIPVRQNFTVRLSWGSRDFEPITVVAHIEGLAHYLVQ